MEAMGQNIYPVIGYTLESRDWGQVELRNSALYWSGRNFDVPGISNVVCGREDQRICDHT